MDITVLTVASEQSIVKPRWLKFVKLGKRGRPQGLDSTLIKFIAGVLRGIAHHKRLNPQVRSATIRAPSIVNPTLAEYLETLGMEATGANGFLKAMRAGQVVMTSAQEFALTIELNP